MRRRRSCDKIVEIIIPVRCTHLEIYVLSSRLHDESARG